MIALAFLTPTTPGTGPAALIVGIMSLAFALGAWARAGLYCNHQDLSPKYAAALLGECTRDGSETRYPVVGPSGGGCASTPPQLLWRRLITAGASEWTYGSALFARHTHAAPQPQPRFASTTRPSLPSGLSNTAGALPGVLGVTFAGYLLDKTGSWASALFFPTAACQLFGLVIYSIFASSKRQGWD